MASGLELNSKLSSSSVPARRPPAPAAARFVDADAAPGLRLTAAGEPCPLRLYAPSASCSRAVSAVDPGEEVEPVFAATPAERPAAPTPRKPGFAWDTTGGVARAPPRTARVAPNGRALACLRRRSMKNRAAAVSATTTAAALPIPANTGAVGPSVPVCAAPAPTAPGCDGAAVAAREIRAPTEKLEREKPAAVLLLATHAGTSEALSKYGAAAAAAILAAADDSAVTTASRRRYASSSAITTADSTAAVALSCTAVLATKPDAAVGTNPGLGDMKTPPPVDSARSDAPTLASAAVLAAGASNSRSPRPTLTDGTTADALSGGWPTMPKPLTASSSPTTTTPPVSSSRHHDSHARAATMPLPYSGEAGAGRSSTTLAASATVLTSGDSRNAPPPAAHTAASGAPANANSKLTVSWKRGGAAATL
jgi:hypothetical protein